MVAIHNFIVAGGYFIFTSACFIVAIVHFIDATAYFIVVYGYFTVAIRNFIVADGYIMFTGGYFIVAGGSLCKFDFLRKIFIKNCGCFCFRICLFLS